jgi:hypothetical protein
MPISQTPRLNLPLLTPGQTLKYITHNEALKTLETLLYLNIEREISHAAESVQEDSFFKVSADAGSEWTAHVNKVAYYQNNRWNFITPLEGQIIWNAQIEALEVWTGEVWTQVSFPINAAISSQIVGVNASADQQNRLTIASPASLFSHEGAGHRLAINKSTKADSASVIFQSNFRGIAEIGLTGDNNFHIKVNTTDDIWYDACILNTDTARVTFPSGLSDSKSGAALSTFIPTPGGDGDVSIFRNDEARLPQPHMAELSSVTNEVLGLASPTASHFFNPIMEGVSLVQIWNISKSPPEPTWVKSTPTQSSLKIFDPATVSNWTTGDVIQIGMPSSISTNAAIAIDISPMMMSLYGRVFRQTGVVLKVGCGSATPGQSKLSIGGSLVSGSQVPLSSYPNGEYAVGQLTLPCSELSPISNSNLIYLTEKAQAGHKLSTSLISVNFLLV